MTPAIKAASAAGISHTVHEYTHDPHAASYGLEAAQAMGVAPARVFKTLLVMLDPPRGRLAVGIVPVDRQLDLKAVASALGAKRAAMAGQREAERATGYVVGGISPLGQKRRLATVLDASALDHATIYVSGGRRGLELELAPADLRQLTQAQAAPISR